jgi:1,4-alpha-glucan branching enzyme
VVRDFYRVPVPCGGFWRELVNTDAAVYGGSGKGNDCFSVRVMAAAILPSAAGGLAVPPIQSSGASSLIIPFA